MELHGTHQRLLVKAALATNGPILELGSGWYSTPILHEIAAAQNRVLITVDNNNEWLLKFEHLRSPIHSLVAVSNWDEFVPGHEFGLVFVDHAPAGRRAVDIRRLVEFTSLFVCHDTEAGGYGYEVILPVLEHVETDRSLPPWTTICRGRRLLSCPFANVK